ncbi:hypothetical protein GGR56DRAFT_672799 [Xylariaceae sp. FL0804]|nr:hypothetical protein GGR56DRAFT_672799 [Xylariaceae sp. FL0804]
MWHVALPDLFSSSSSRSSSNSASERRLAANECATSSSSDGSTSSTNVSASISREPLYPATSAAGRHHDVASYAAYAARVGLDPASKTYVGTRYEYVVAAALRGVLGFGPVRRVGGRADRGIDLLGEWRVPSSSPLLRPLRVLVQCKAVSPRAASSSSSSSSEVGPRHVRELEGAFAGAPPGWRGGGDSSEHGNGNGGVLGVYVTPRPATRGIRDALATSRWPMAFVCCSRDGLLTQVLWNRRAEEEGLAGLGVAVRHSQDAPREQSSVVLTWKGEPYEPEPPPEPPQVVAVGLDLAAGSEAAEPKNNTPALEERVATASTMKPPGNPRRKRTKKTDVAIEEPEDPKTAEHLRVISLEDALVNDPEEAAGVPGTGSSTSS